MSVGDYVGSNGYLTLAERWNGKSWAIVLSPNLVGAKNDILSGLSRPGPHWCTAVGYSLTARSVQRALVEAWNGTKWAIQPTALPAGPAGSAGLDAVSCTAPDSCTAVGGFAKPGVYAQSQPLTEFWNGSTWAVVPSPNPHAENGSSLAGVSCTAANGGNQGETLAERWNGATWAIQRSPDPAGFTGAALDGVSCPRPLACTAVGSWSANANGTLTDTLAEYWNGTRWSLQSTPNPVAAKITGLSGVACTPAGTCVAVGDFWNGTSTQTLIESRSR